MTNFMVQLRRFQRKPLLLKLYYLLTVPLSTLFILNSTAIHPSYRFGTTQKLRLGLRMFVNTIRIPTGTSYKTHLAMALKLLETPPGVVGDVMECGTWKGGSAVNLSLVCDIVGRTLKICDSFQGLPKSDALDREGPGYAEGDYSGTLDEVRHNLQCFGAIRCCEFVPGWFADTLPGLNTPVLLAFLDVDLEASLDTCVRHIWPNLVDEGFIFIDEAASLDYCALFFSERWWSETFQQTPPGLIGAGVGLALGEFYIGPWRDQANHPLQHQNAGAYTCKRYSGYWTYYKR